MADLKQVLTIAGSDSGGGSGIQADLKTMAANGVFGLSVITSVTAQNTREIVSSFDLPLEIIRAQIEAVFDDFDVAAVKTGMLASKEIVETVAEALRKHGAKNLVVDPVMVSKSGYDLLRSDAVTVIREALLPLATVVTPNIHEAECLTGISVETLEQAKEAAWRLHKMGCRAVLVKGGHLSDQRATDVLFDGDKMHLIAGTYIDTQNTHGTGCTYASAIAAHLGLGKPLIDAVREAKSYLTEVIRHGLSIGHGHGPMNHFYFLK